MAKETYPLKQVLEIKKRRVEEAEKVVQQKREALAVEEEKLEKAKAERDKVKKHHQDKLDQLRRELDQTTKSDKVLQMKAYLKVVKEKLKLEEKKVKDQQQKVDQANKELEEARHQLKLKRLEVDKVELHKKDWEKVKRKEFDIAEEKEMDEIGNVTFTMRKKQWENLEK